MFSAPALFKAVFENAKENCILIMDTGGTVLSINHAFTECFGYGDEDIVGKSGIILFTEQDREKGKFQHELAETQTKGQSNDNNYLVNKNGEVTWVSGESVLAQEDSGGNIIVKIIQNIHKQKTTEISLTELNAFNENILESIKDSVLVLNDQLDIVKANNAFLNTFELDPSELHSFSFRKKFGKTEGARRIIENLEQAARSKTGFSNKHLDIRDSSGDIRVFEITASPLVNDAASHILVIFHDVTMRKELEKEREDMLGFIMHELRNPLSNVMLVNEVMREAINEDNRKLMHEMIERSGKNVERMRKIIGEMYATTKVDSGQLALSFSTFPFEEMIKEAVETVAVLNPSYKIDIEGSAAFPIAADRYRIIQVITNYLSNAIKYSGGSSDIRLIISEANNMVIVAVQDYGMGISKEQLPFLFERFYRAGKKASIEGIGLGLYLCRQIIKAHKGHVWVESEPGKGSTFYFSLPKEE